jgi:hypothetical protein
VVTSKHKQHHKQSLANSRGLDDHPARFVPSHRLGSPEDRQQRHALVTAGATVLRDHHVLIDHGLRVCQPNHKKRSEKRPPFMKRQVRPGLIFCASVCARVCVRTHFSPCVCGSPSKVVFLLLKIRPVQRSIVFGENASCKPRTRISTFSV